MKSKLYLCDQKKDCKGSTRCGIDCYLTTDREHKAAAIYFDDDIQKFIPVDFNEEFRDYLTQLANERGGIL